MAKKKLDGAVDEFSANQEVRKSNTTTLLTCENSGGLQIAEPGLTSPSVCPADKFRQGLKF